jgi:hypothetical protein
MDWIPGVVVALIGIAGVLLSQRMSLKAAETARKEHRKIQASRRWDDQRLSAYADMVSETMILLEIVGRLGPHWEKDEAPPEDLLHKFEDQRDIISRAHMRAFMVASRPVRNALRRLWDRSVEVGKALDRPSDGSETADQMTARHSTELGVLIGKLQQAVAIELGIDDAVDPV